MIFALLIFIGFIVCKACSLMADYIDHQEAERRRFYTALENDLNRLDRLIQSNKKKHEEPEMILIKKEWAGRN